MLVHALCLRERGIKLDPHELRAMEPLLGWLRYEDNVYQGRDGRGAMTCLLMPPDHTSTDPIVQLHRTRIKIETRGILIRGIEDEYKRKERTEYPQSLWCWPAVTQKMAFAALHPETLRPDMQASYGLAGKRSP